MPNSYQIKTALLKYFRFQRSMIVGTEINCGVSGIADVLAINDNQSLSYEVEIKTSIADLRKDFKDKNFKHSSLNHDKRYNPNYFYFCVPEELYEKSKEIIYSNNKQYGIIIYEIDRWNYGFVKIMNRAKKLNTSDNEYLFIALLKRISSEIVNLYIENYERGIV